MLDSIDRDFIRSLAAWRADGVPVSTLYLDVDGRRYPRRQDVEDRAEALCHEFHAPAEETGREVRRSIQQDAARFVEFVGQFDRGPTRGLALFSCSARGLWAEAGVPRSVADRAVVAPHAELPQTEPDRGRQKHECQHVGTPQARGPDLRWHACQGTSLQVRERSRRGPGRV